MSAFWNPYTSLVGLLPPSRLKNWLLSRRPGYTVDPSARIGITFIRNVAAMRIGPDVSIGFGNVLWNMREFAVDSRGLVGHMNWFSASPMFLVSSSPGVPAEAGTVSLGADSITVSRHRFDCSGGYTLGAWAIIGGAGTLVLTHTVSIADAKQIAKPVRIGEYCFISSRCMILNNVTLADRVVLAAGSVVPKSLEKEFGFYAGVPAEWKKEVSADIKIFTRPQGLMGVRDF